MKNHIVMTICKTIASDRSKHSDFSFEKVRKEPLLALALIAVQLVYIGGYLCSLSLLSNLGLGLTTSGLLSKETVIFLLFCYAFAAPLIFFYRNVFRKESQTDLFKLFKNTQSVIAGLFGKNRLITPYPPSSEFKQHDSEFQTRVVGVPPPPPKSFS